MAETIQNNPFNRPPRIQDAFQSTEIDIPAPPAPMEEPARNLLLMLLPMGSFMVMGLFYALIFRGGASGVSGWLYALPMIAMSVFTFASSFVMYGEQKHEQKKKWLKQLRDYHRMLDKKESRLLAGRNLQRDLLFARFASPEVIIRRVKNLELSLWERRQEDPDFLAFRVGLGQAPSKVSIKHPDPDIISDEIRRAFGLYTEYRSIPNVPIYIDFQEMGSVAIVGKRGSTIPLARTILVQLAALNSPDDVHICMFSSKQDYRTWQWLRWLPHTSQVHVGGQPDFLAFDREENKKLMAQISKEIDAARQSSEDKADPGLPATAFFMVFDNASGARDEPFFDQLMKVGKEYNAYSVVICDSLEDVPSDCQGIIDLDKEEFKFSKVGADGFKLAGIYDKVDFVDADNLSNRLIPISIRSLGQGNRIPTQVNLLQVYQAASIEQLNILEKWKRTPPQNGLLPFVIPIGSETYSTSLQIHLAENQDGPHGLVAGTTGSGKSELLQMLVSALAIEHHPYLVNFLLIDFKGESTFGVFKNLPHTVGLVSNLDKISALRALEAIKAENTRRQKFLRDQGVEEITEYHKKLHRAGSIKKWEPLPHLFIIVDEFAEMARDMPSFLPELVATVRVGRSLGLHLILATQRPAGVVTDEMRANINFRICLRVQGIDDSRDMLRRPDAALLPHNLPGRAYFQLGDGGTPRQFQVARAGVDYEDFSEQSGREINRIYKLVNEKKELVYDAISLDAEGGDKEKPTIAKVLSEHLQKQYQQMGYDALETILLPPLPDPDHLDPKDPHKDRLKSKEFFSKMAYKRWDDESGSWSTRQNPNEFRIPIGIVDSLATRSQPPHWIDFLNFGGHVMVVGGPQSGKTAFLQTLVYGLARGFDPSEVNIYVLSFAGRELEVVQDLPHVGSVIQGYETEKLQRLLRYLENQQKVRENRFSQYKAKDLLEFNSQALPEERLPYICIMIDNFGELRNPEYDDKLVDIERLIQTGRLYGIHFVITALQGNDIPYKVSNLIQQRLAFNIADRHDYMTIVGRPESLEFDSLPKGRAFIAGSPPMQCQVAFPPDREEWARLSCAMQTKWGDRSKPQKIETLVSSVYLSKLYEDDDCASDTLRDKVGIDGDTLKPFELGWNQSWSHLLVGGPPQSGRTSLLHTIVLSLTNNRSPEDFWVVLMDGSSGNLRGLEDLPHVIERVDEEDGLTRNIACLQTELEYRRKEVDKAASRSPDRLTFPDILFVMDDYDLTNEALAINDVILAEIGKHMRKDIDLGFHLLLSVSPENLHGGGDPIIKQFRLARAGISLSNIDTLEFLGGRPTTAMRRDELVRGRGYFVNGSAYKQVQFAKPDMYKTVENKWVDFPRASWPHPAEQNKIEQVRKNSAPEFQRGSLLTRGNVLIDLDESVKRYREQQQILIKKGKDNK